MLHCLAADNLQINIFYTNVLISHHYPVYRMGTRRYFPGVKVADA
jgi:hypothetical protein